jgi:hypothetical protein
MENASSFRICSSMIILHFEICQVCVIVSLDRAEVKMVVEEYRPIRDWYLGWVEVNNRALFQHSFGLVLLDVT